MKKSALLSFSLLFTCYTFSQIDSVALNNVFGKRERYQGMSIK